MTEATIERMVEAMIDALDRRFLNSPMTQADYNEEVRKIDRWAAAQRCAARA